MLSLQMLIWYLMVTAISVALAGWRGGELIITLSLLGVPMLLLAARDDYRRHRRSRIVEGPELVDAPIRHDLAKHMLLAQFGVRHPIAATILASALFALGALLSSTLGPLLASLCVIAQLLLELGVLGAFARRRVALSKARD